jgi:hypothetical protein
MGSRITKDKLIEIIEKALKDNSDGGIPWEDTIEAVANKVLIATSRQEPMTIEDAIRAMNKHSLEFPSHGYNCACKDVYIRAARNYLHDMQADFIGLPYEEFQSLEHADARIFEQNVAYLLGSLWRR